MQVKRCIHWWRSARPTAWYYNKTLHGAKSRNLLTICPPKYAIKNSRNTWQMFAPNCQPLLSGNRKHLYVHALVCLNGCSFISVCDLDVTFQRLLRRRITSTHQFSSRVPLTLSCWQHVLFSLLFIFGHKAGKQTSVYLCECYNTAGNSLLQTDLLEEHLHGWCNDWRVGWDRLFRYLIIYRATLWFL